MSSRRTRVDRLVLAAQDTEAYVTIAITMMGFGVFGVFQNIYLRIRHSRRPTGSWDIAELSTAKPIDITEESTRVRSARVIPMLALVFGVGSAAILLVDLVTNPELGPRI